ncbi:MAG: energy-coupling factor ABC transporter ATP-binding protein [Turicibacter sp.]|nr:energy-coupling factor ABC transporter ATP-binding protein [Turicibacter sp.]
MALFKLENVAFKGIIQYPNFEIKEKAATFITGESGVGKSTLLKLLNGVLTPTEGHVYWVEKKLTDVDSIVLRRKVLLVSQSAVLFDEHTIEENFKLFFDYRDQAAPSSEEMTHFLAMCSIVMPLDARVYELSGGEKQRVFVAIHLALGFDALLMDEPTSALDEKNGFAMLRNIKAYCKEQGKSLVIVSHDKEIVENFADDVIVLGGEA